MVISYQFWQRRFAGDRTSSANKSRWRDNVHTITGVMPRGWKFPIQPENVDYIAPLLPLYSGSFSDLHHPSRRALSSRLSVASKPGVDLRTATADLQTIAAQLAKQYPDSDAGRTERAVDLQSDAGR